MATGRKRVRSNVSVKPVTLDIFAPGPPRAFLERQTAGRVDNYTFHEVFEDSADNWRVYSNLRKEDRPIYACFHEKQYWLGQKPYPSWVDFNEVVSVDYPFPSHPVLTRARVPSPPESVIQECALAAFNSFHTQVPLNTSIGNFLWELREIKGLIPKLSANLLKTANDGFLNYSFGWKPFLEDLKNLGTLVEGVRKRLKFLKDTSGKSTRIHFYKEGIYTPTGNLALDFLDDVGNPVTGLFFIAEERLMAALRYYQCNFRASGRLFQKLEGLDSALGEFTAFSAALGLNNPIRIFWNAIPYSFVADWFFKIGRRLDVLSQRAFDGVWDVSHVSCSYDLRALVDWYAHPWGSFGNPVTFCGSVVVEEYRRYVGLPVGCGEIHLNDLDSTKQMLLGALLAARTLK
jgi:hypothetical protein